MAIKLCYISQTLKRFRLKNRLTNRIIIDVNIVILSDNCKYHHKSAHNQSRCTNKMRIDNFNGLLPIIIIKCCT